MLVSSHIFDVIGFGRRWVCSSCLIGAYSLTAKRRDQGAEVPGDRGLRLERQDRAAPTRGTAEPEEVGALVGADIGDTVALPDQRARRRDLRALVAQPRAPRAIQKA